MDSLFTAPAVIRLWLVAKALCPAPCFVMLGTELLGPSQSEEHLHCGYRHGWAASLWHSWRLGHPGMSHMAQHPLPGWGNEDVQRGKLGFQEHVR